MNKVEGKLSFEASLPPLFTLGRVEEVVGEAQPQAHQREGWHPPCTLQEHQRSVKIPIQGKTAIWTVEHPVFQAQILVDSSALETLA